MLTYCTMWSQSTDPLSAYSYPGPTVAGPINMQLPASPAWVRIGYRYRWNTDASGYGIAATASEIANQWYFQVPMRTA